jgi:peptidoglycan/xylan/chitin deacetylase (PgdA/CDA1 family)
VSESKWRKPWIACQWLIVAACACFLVWTLIQRSPKLDYQRTTWHSWEGFAALSYADISRGAVPPDVSPKRLAQQLETLKNAGYKTVTLEDAASFLAGEAPLPEKALVLLFEGARRETFLTVTPLLRRLGYTASLCLPTSYLAAGGRFYLSEDDFRKITREPHWQLASMGHKAITRIPLDEKGTEGHFLTRRIWTGGQAEKESDFLKRVADDYLRAVEVLQRINGGSVTAYLFPYADAGQSRASDPLAYELNYRAVSSLHRLAFLGSRQAFNGPAANPHSLTRLRVSGEWDGPYLLRRLEQSRISRPTPATVLEPELWNMTEGARFEGGDIRLDSGAMAWLRGSDLWPDVQIQAVIQTSDDSLGAFYVRHDGPRNHVSLTVSRDALALQEKVPGNRVTILSRLGNPDPGRAEYQIRLQTKGKRAWFSYGEEAAGRPTPLSGQLQRGVIGVASLQGSVTIRNLNIRPIRPVYVVGKPFRSLTASEREAATTVMPPLPFPDNPADPDRAFVEDLMAAASHGLFTAPLLLNEEKRPAAAWLEVLQTGILKPLIHSVTVRGTADGLAGDLRKAGYRVFRIVSPEEALVCAVDGKSGNDTFLLHGDPSEMGAALQQLLYSMPPERLAACLPEGGVPPRIGAVMGPPISGFMTEGRP